MSEHPHRLWHIVRNISLFFLAAFVLLLAYVGFLTILRDAPRTALHAGSDGTAPPASDSPAFESSLGLLTSTDFQSGNHVDLLINGNETYPALWQSLRAARRSITVQLYYMEPGKLTDSLVTVLSERARAGVQTFLLHDAIGSTLTDSAAAHLKAAGVHVATFRPVKSWTLHKAQNRSHVRAVVIDGETGFTGGFGIDDRWAGDGRHADQWRDTNVRVRGPVVRQIQAAFDRAWTEATGHMLVGDLFFPDLDVTAARDTSATVTAAGLLYSVATFGQTANARLFALAVASARHTLYISNAYFVPDPSILTGLRAAASRGVDVRLLLPGDKTDVPMTRYAARSWYETLIRSGVKVFEYQPGMLHAKTFVIDGVFTSVGSMNLDYRSFALNDEANMLIFDRTFGARMDSVYREDLRYATQIDLRRFERRGRWEKFRERFARAIGRAL